MMSSVHTLVCRSTFACVKSKETLLAWNTGSSPREILVCYFSSVRSLASHHTTTLTLHPPEDQSTHFSSLPWLLLFSTFWHQQQCQPRSPIMHGDSVWWVGIIPTAALKSSDRGLADTGCISIFNPIRIYLQVTLSLLWKLVAMHLVDILEETCPHERIYNDCSPNWFIFLFINSTFNSLIQFKRTSLFSIFLNIRSNFLSSLVAFSSVHSQFLLIQASPTKHPR